jgi:putative membrane protein
VNGGFPPFRAHPEVDLILLAAGVGYWWVTSRKVHATRRHKILFGTGLLLMWVFASWPIHDLGEDLLYSVHMAQHTVFAYVVPPLLLLGCPPDLIRWLVRNPVLGFCCRTFARPFVAIVLFNVEGIALHLPPVVNRATTSGPLHFAVHLALFLVALCLWFPVVNTVDELPRLAYGPKMLYLIASSFLPVVPVAFLALAADPIYAHYANAPRLTGLDPVGDQQAAAGVMWLISSFWMTGTIGFVFLDWWRTSQRDPATASYLVHASR